MEPGFHSKLHVYKCLILKGGAILEVKNSVTQGYLVSSLWLVVCVLTKMAMNAEE